MQDIALRESRLTIANGIAEFSHQRPKARNAISTDLIEDYGELIDRIHADRSILGLIITGSGGSFCAGGDIGSMRDRQACTDPDIIGADFVRRRLDRAHRMLKQLRELDVPVIAAVDGPAYGAGFGLALQADFILASERASFCLSFARIGAVPDWGTAYTLPRIVGMARAKELVLTARRVDAKEALALGIALSVHPTDELSAQAHAMARRLAAGPREAFGLAKRMLNSSFETEYATLAALEGTAQAVCLSSDYHQRAVARFMQGEPSLYDWDHPANAE
ncbi:enoyl-CoA hydratase/isomerase family protein [Pseudomonas sp. H9]|nr:enoyl-CoA hydratase/isomerase family protein [Pseudomonas sp. H9]